jgi:hypothetical protein
MARQKPPLDPPDVILARQEAMLDDPSTIIVKNGSGQLMQYFGEGNITFVPYNGHIPKPKAIKELKPSMGKWDYKWFSKYEVEESRTGNWELVECDIKDEDANEFFSSECYAPFARGSKVDGYIHRMDAILCHLNLEQSRKINDHIVLRSNPTPTPEEARQEMVNLGASEATASFTKTEDKVEITDKR